MFPILNPPPTSLPIPSLWVIPVHQPQACCILYPVSCIEPIRWRIQNRLRLPAALLWGFLSVDLTSSLVPLFLLLAEFDSCDFTRCAVIKSSPTAGLRRFITFQENNILGLRSLQQSSLNGSFFANVHSISNNSIFNMLQHCYFSILAAKAPASSPLMM